MGRKHSILEYLSQHNYDSEALPFLPIVEIAGEHRALVENHDGVCQYTPEHISILVKYGEIHLSGCGLSLKHMTQTKLLVTGKLEHISLIRRKRC